nr:DNA polymerase III subunit gamma/tau [Bacillota bacterium]
MTDRMAYLALYRAWRPQRFADVVGQEHVRRTLQNALSEGRLAHAYLFSGPRGTGKTSLAKILAKAVNCERGPAPEPCNECDTCRQISEGRQLDVVEIDAASHRGVDEIRELRDKVKYAPTAVRYKVYIIDEVHMLTTEAFNALLKTLEEPPPHVLFILATTEPHKIPVTILSRCQRFDFARLSTRQIVERLQQIAASQGVEAVPEALQTIAHLADGGMRDALSLLDQVISFADGKVTEEEVLLVSGGIPRQDVVRFWQALSADGPQRLFELAQQWFEQGKEPAKVLEWLLDYGRWILLAKVSPELEEVQERLAYDPHLAELAETLPMDRTVAQMDLLRTAVQEMKWVEQPRIFLELTLLKMWRVAQQDAESTQADSAAQRVPPSEGDSPLAQLVQEVRQLRERVRQLESRLGDGSSMSGHSPVRVSSGGAVATGKKAGDSPNGALQRLLQESTPEWTRRVQERWEQVLRQVKQKRVFV